jgi:hypothetical protein
MGWLVGGFHAVMAAPVGGKITLPVCVGSGVGCPGVKVLSALRAWAVVKASVVEGGIDVIMADCCSCVICARSVAAWLRHVVSCTANDV